MFGFSRASCLLGRFVLGLRWRSRACNERERVIRITLYSGPSDTDDRQDAVSVHLVDEADVHERLRQIGLEWTTADYMPQRQVLIALDPVVPNDRAEIKQRVRAAAVALEETGLL